MLLKTHLSITIFFILIFISSVESKIIFVLVAIIATYLPDIDSRYSKIGHRRIARILQVFTKHRGLIHSFTFLFMIILILVLFLPVASFGFFLGYSSHLLADSFTREGIAPFYPWRKKSKGFIKTGGRIEISLLIFFVIVDLLLIFLRVF